MIIKKKSHLYFLESKDFNPKNLRLNITPSLGPYKRLGIQPSELYYISKEDYKTKEETKEKKLKKKKKRRNKGKDININ